MPPDVLDDLLAAGIRDRLVDLGDPGVTHDRDTPRADLPPYIGPLEPVGGHVHEWGAAVAEAPDDAPLEGPALAPYEPGRRAGRLTGAARRLARRRARA